MRTPARPSSVRAQRPVADERQRAAAEPRERVGEPDDVLALGERADVDERGLLELRRSVDRGEALEVDARVDDLGLAARLGQPLLELPAQVVRDGDHGRRALDDLPRQARDAGDGADVP